jgi:hypothetical protein
MVPITSPDYRGVHPHDDDIVEARIIDVRPRRRRLLAPLAAGAAALAGCVLVFAIDPNEPGHYPVCPTRAILGIDCPGCGLMRGTHDLLHGNIAGAVDHNLLIPVLLPLVLLLWLGWLKRASTGIRPAVTRARFRRRNRLLVIGLVILLAFGIVRNFVPYLDSGSVLG